MRKLLCLLLLPLCLLANATSDDSNRFAFALHSELPEAGNTVFSPYAIFSHLALLYNGAEGETAEQIKSVLHLSAKGDHFLNSFHKHLIDLTGKSDHGYHFFLHNALFPHKGTHFTASYKEKAKYFDAHLQSVDYPQKENTLETINGWFARSTDDTVSSVLTKKDIDDQTRMLTASASYFKGAWAYPFQSKKGMFTPSASPPKEVEMMSSLHAFPYHGDDEMEAISIPLARDGFRQPPIELLIVIPKKPLHFTAKMVDEVIYKLKPTGMSVVLPKFCFSQTFPLKAPLKELGIKDAFTYQADFSGINQMKDLLLNEVFHTTYFSIHEKGISAPSACLNDPKAHPPPPIVEEGKEFVADRPFSFFLFDHHCRSILFMGHVEDPTSEKCE